MALGKRAGPLLKEWFRSGPAYFIGKNPLSFCASGAPKAK